MSITVLTKIYDPPEINRKEILRYAGCKEANGEIISLLDDSIKETADKLTYKVCFCELSVNICGNICDFDAFKVESSDLALNLKDCKRVILFAATVGLELDRLIARYSKISPAKALLIQSVGAERIEALCDGFSEDIKRAGGILKPRFSPGYGDLPLDTQEKIFAVLCPFKNIGLTLNDSKVMSPSKSVTAFMGIK